MTEKIGERMIQIGAMTGQQVDVVLDKQRSGDDRLFGEIAIELGYVNDSAISEHLKLKPGCQYRGKCHFYGIKKMTPDNLRLRELYCLEWPEKCAIFQQKRVGKPVSITLWPVGELKR